MNANDYTRREILVYWLPVVAWAAVILAASSDFFSAKHSGEWLGEIIIRIVGHPLPSREFDAVHFVIRKLAHLTEYFILGVLCYRALRGDEAGWRVRWAVVAIALAATVAVLDEWHQFFVLSRTSSGWDVLLDTAGASLAQMAGRASARPPG